MKPLFDELICWFEFFLFRVPGRIGSFLRGTYVRYLSMNSAGRASFAPSVCLTGIRNMKLSQDVAFGEGCMLHSLMGKISIGERSHFTSGVILGADFGSIQIGKDVLVGPNVVMRASNHRFDRSPNVTIVKQGHEHGEIVIGDDVWIGANVTILAGAEIGDHCVIGAGAVVNGKIPSCTVAVGLPAKVIRNII